MKRLIPLFVVLLGACATAPDDILRNAPDDSPSLTEVLVAPERFAERRVLWAGSLASLENREQRTEIEIVARPLDRSGRPRETDQSAGRFVGRFAGFLDPAIYTEGREVTVVGRLDGMARRTVGDYSLQMPVVNVDSIKLWPPRSQYESYRYPYPYPYPYGVYDYPYPFLDPYWYPYLPHRRPHPRWPVVPVPDPTRK